MTSWGENKNAPKGAFTDLHANRLTVEVINHIEQSERAAIFQLVMQKGRITAVSCG